MVSKRRRLAKKRFKEENPLLFPKPEPRSEDDGAEEEGKKKKKLGKTLKRGVGKPGRDRGGNRFTGSRHPLRIPGQRPGECCFVCGADDHMAKACPKKAEWEKNKICLLCRRRGHSLKNCPKKKDETNQKLCYNCGDAGHSLNNCPQPLQDGGAKFATCFICSQQGHLSKDCPKNAHGIYPKGGCCKLCGGVTHLAKNCPMKGSRELAVYGSETNSGDSPKAFRENHTVFRSGDDLEDDFSGDEEPKTSKKSKNFNAESDGGHPEVSSKGKNGNFKMKNGPKVVTFLG